MAASFSILPAWNLDALGNAGSVTTQGAIQTNSYNSQNEMTGAGSAALAFDANGNTTTDDQGHMLVYDAWNRLVKATDATGTTVLAAYTYDAGGRRVTETESGNINHLYYSAQWQVLEERLGGTSSVNVTQQYVWSATYVDAMILSDSYWYGMLTQRLYAQYDANYNVTALVSPVVMPVSSGGGSFGSAWEVMERYVYDPYGKVTVLNADATVRGNGTVAASAFGWRYLHQGGRFDTATGLYNFRHRDYSPTMQRWLEQDPAGYRGDPAHGNFYRYVGGNPLSLTDASGLCPENGSPGSPGSNNKSPAAKAATPNKAGNAAGGRDYGNGDTRPVPAVLPPSTTHQNGSGTGSQGGASAITWSWLATTLGHAVVTALAAGVVIGSDGLNQGPLEESLPILEQDLTAILPTLEQDLAAAWESSPAITAAENEASVATPYGNAVQSLTPEATALRDSVAEGQQIFRAGNFPKSAGAEGQFWSPQSPLTPDYANSVGAANLDAGTPDFILGGSVNLEANFITRYAPAYGGNDGGALEIVTQPGGVQTEFFHMP